MNGVSLGMNSGAANFRKRSLGKPFAKIFPILRGFFAWWLGELGALVPQHLRHILRPPPHILLVEIMDKEIMLRLLQGGRRREVGHVDLDGLTGEAQGMAMRELLGRIDLSGVEVALRLPAEQALRQRLELPLMAEPDLRQALMFQIDRQTPFEPDEVCFDYRVSARTPGAKRVTVEMTLVPRGLVSAAVAKAKTWGLDARIVDVAYGERNATPRINLLVSERPGARAGAWSPLTAMLAVCAAGLLAAAVYIPLEQRRETSEALLAMIAEAKSDADDVLRLREDVDRLAGENQFLIEQKRNHPSQVVILDELTSVLPDDTWLYELTIDGNQMRLAGYSSAASSLIGLIGDASMFRAPKFRSPVTRDPKTGVERFKLSLEFAG